MKPRYFIFVVLAFAALAPVAFAQTAANSSFVPLTQIPAITQFANSPTNGTLVSFFNSIYEYCVGIAGALAVFMIIWAGVTWMTAGDSAEKVSQARKRIGDALFGLVLVLSPAIVFGIINPNVLTLSLNFNSLTPNPPTGAATTNALPAASSPGAANPQLNQQICADYTQLAYTPVSGSQTCLSQKGNGWAQVDCCVGTAPSGDVCCGYSSTNVQPTPTSSQTPFAGPYSFSIAYKDTDSSGNACVSYNDQGGFQDINSCTTAFNKIVQSATTQVLQSCGQSGQSSITSSSLAGLSTCKD